MTKSLPARGGETEMDSQKIEEIYGRHADMVFSVSFSYLKNTEDAKDVVSEIFLKLLQKRIRFNDAEHEKAWLLRATINKCKDFLKDWRRKNENIDDHEYLESGDPFQTDETYELVLKLPDRYKAVIYLHYYEGYKTEEIGRMLKKPQSTVLSQLREARKLLKGALENEK
ncbi:MAG: sigma-70 family RNA polymerase sigma factor [Oscillospiraceae bacterium]|jgi:RNA polymerase sigma-70 factor (ECF subfamily)|nr:sigma-70 family RNA polymerase sigma factor [Oscillospiraceae bacterium]